MLKVMSRILQILSVSIKLSCPKDTEKNVFIIANCKCQQNNLYGYLAEVVFSVRKQDGKKEG